MYDIIIVGAGMAGLTASIYSRRSNKSVLVLEKLAYGGQIINTLSIENYPATPNISGFDLSTSIYNQAKDLGVEFKFEEVLELVDCNEYKVIKTNKSEYQAKAIILATGSKYRKLGLDNEDKLLGAGVAYCATCDGNFYKGKDVAVVGGGNTALEDALYLSNIASHVYLIVRKDKFRGDAVTIDQVRSKNNIEILFNSNVIKLNFDTKLNSIDIDTNGEISTTKVDGLFVAIGREPENNFVKDLLQTDEYGYILSEDCKTNIPGIYVAGDNRTKVVRQLVTAASDGAIASREAVNYINSLKKD